MMWTRRAILDHLISYAGGGTTVAGGGIVAQAPHLESPQTLLGMLIAFLGVALPLIFKELDRRRKERGLARKLARAEEKLKALETHHIHPNTVQIAAIGGEMAVIREALTNRSNPYFRQTGSTDSMPTIKPALLVEDDPEQAEYLAKLLMQAGYETRTAPTLAKALEAIGGHTPPPALVMLDLGLPDGDGLDVVREARRLRLPSRFVVTTGNGDPARRDQVAATLRPRDAFYVKPVDFHQLVQAILPQPAPTHADATE